MIEITTEQKQTDRTDQNKTKERDSNHSNQYHFETETKNNLDLFETEKPEST